jgi:hypothetical protein
MGELPPSELRAETSSETENVANRCIACREEIRPSAKVCTQCNQFQDWRRFFGLSSTVSVQQLRAALAQISNRSTRVARTALSELVRVHQDGNLVLVLGAGASIEHGL